MMHSLFKDNEETAIQQVHRKYKVIGEDHILDFKKFLDRI